MRVLEKPLQAAVAGGVTRQTDDASVLASIGSGAGIGGFDGNGVGPTSCVAMPPAGSAGLFGLGLTETLAVGTGADALGGALGGGQGASFAIEAAGGWAGLGTLEAGAVGVTSAAGIGLLGALAAGVGAGLLVNYVAGDAISADAPAALSGFANGFTGWYTGNGGSGGGHIGVAAQSDD